MIDLDEPAGPGGLDGATSARACVGSAVRAGRADGRPGQRRVYSNVGFETLAEHIAARAEMPFDEYLAAGVLQPLGMQAELHGFAGSEHCTAASTIC